MKATTVRLIQMVEGQMVPTEFPIESLIPAMAVRGYPFVGFNGQLSGRFKLREEIAGQPIFSGLCGPMYDGPGIVRYEDGESYEVLST